MSSTGLNNAGGCLTVVFLLAGAILYCGVVWVAWDWVSIVAPKDSPVGPYILKATGLATLAWAVRSLFAAANEVAKDIKPAGDDKRS